MASGPDDFWQAAQRVEETAGPFAALIFVSIFGLLWAGTVFLAAWAVSATFGSPFWMTALCIALLRFALN